MRYCFVPNWQVALNIVTRLISKHYVTKAANLKQSRAKNRANQHGGRLAAELVEIIICQTTNASSTATNSLHDYIYEQ
jgi:hypothetical protein